MSLLSGLTIKYAVVIHFYGPMMLNYYTLYMYFYTFIINGY